MQPSLLRRRLRRRIRRTLYFLNTLAGLRKCPTFFFSSALEMTRRKTSGVFAIGLLDRTLVSLRTPRARHRCSSSVLGIASLFRRAIPGSPFFGSCFYPPSLIGALEGVVCFRSAASTDQLAFASVWRGIARDKAGKGSREKFCPSSTASGALLFQRTVCVRKRHFWSCKSVRIPLPVNTLPVNQVGTPAFVYFPGTSSPA